VVSFPVFFHTSVGHVFLPPFSFFKEKEGLAPCIHLFLSFVQRSRPAFLLGQFGLPFPTLGLCRCTPISRPSFLLAAPQASRRSAFFFSFELAFSASPFSQQTPSSPSPKPGFELFVVLVPSFKQLTILFFCPPFRPTYLPALPPI